MTIDLNKLAQRAQAGDSAAVPVPAAAPSDADQIKITKAAAAMLLDLMDNPPQPNEKLLEVWAKHAKLITTTAAAPKAALTDEQLEALISEEYAKSPRGEELDLHRFAKAIMAASGPNAALIEALQGMVQDFEGCYADAEPAMVKARAALAAAGIEVKS